MIRWILTLRKRTPLFDEKLSHAQLREAGEGHVLLQGRSITFLHVSKTCVVQVRFTMTRLDDQQVVIGQMLIPLCVREIRDVKHLHTIVVGTALPNGKIEFGQTVDHLCLAEDVFHCGKVTTQLSHVSV